MKDNCYKLYSSLSELEQFKTWAEIDLDALRHNYRQLTSACSSPNNSPRIIAVVKAEAYGHGAPQCVRTLLSEGCDFFAVSCIEEAVAVRNICLTEKSHADILILGYTCPSLADELAQHNIIQTLISPEYAKQLQIEAHARNVTVRAHVALDTGMNRIGFPAHNEQEIHTAAEAILAANRLPNLLLEGMFTHFSNADEIPMDHGDTDRQFSRYHAVCRRLEENGLSIPFLHTCNSAAALLRPEYRFHGVRIGLPLYGADPLKGSGLPLQPVLRLKTVISHIHPLLPGEAVSYGGSFVAEAERTIATIPIGYADGFLRAYSGATVTVNTTAGPHSAPVIGRICMDQCMLDVTNLGASVGDVVTLFGNDPRQLEEYAKRAGTITYECLCLITSRVPRCYLST